MKIGMLGFSFKNANMGCEALTYSFIAMLNELYPKNLEVIDFTYGKNLGNVPAYFKNIKFSAFHVKFKNPIPTIKKMSECNAIFDITYGDNFSDIYNPRFVFRTTLAKEWVLLSGTPLYLAPQTYGPFQKKWLQSFAAHIIKKSKKVYSRDDLSSQYVMKIAGRKPITVTDLALSLPYHPNTKLINSKFRLGINVSGLLWKGGFFSNNQFRLTVNYKTYIDSIISHYVNDENCEIHLIPHVIGRPQTDDDDDVDICIKLGKKYTNVNVAPIFTNPMETKNYIAAMDILIGGRMHATVDAFSSNVPVIPFSYSRKFEGLYNSIGYDYLIDGCKLSTDKAISLTIKWIEARDELKRVESTSMNIVLEKNSKFKNDIKHELEIIGAKKNE